MSRFSFSLLLVLVFNSYSHLVMSKRKSKIPRDHHHSSQIVNFSAGTSQANVTKQQNSSSSYSLSQLQPPFQTLSLTSSSSARNNDNSLNIHTSPFPSKRSHQTNGNTVSGGMRNYNDLFACTPADFMSLPQQERCHTERGQLSQVDFILHQYDALYQFISLEFKFSCCFTHSFLKNCCENLEAMRESTDFVQHFWYLLKHSTSFSISMGVISLLVNQLCWPLHLLGSLIPQPSTKLSKSR